MIVKNNKTGIEYHITKEDWEKLTERKLSRNYKIVDPNDQKTNPLAVPKEIVEYQSELRIKPAEKIKKPTEKK